MTLMTGIFEPSSCYCCMRMLLEQERSSAAASARPARRIEITAEGSKLAGIPAWKMVRRGRLCSLSAQAKMLLRRMRRRSSRWVDEEMGIGAIMPKISQAGRKS